MYVKQCACGACENVVCIKYRGQYNLSLIPEREGGRFDHEPIVLYSPQR